MHELLVKEDMANIRIDKALANVMQQSRTQIAKMIDEEYIKVNDNKVKANYILELNDRITVEDRPKKELGLEAEDLGLEIVYEDNDVAVVNKPKGMVVHPANGNETGTLVNGLLYEMDLEETINDTIRPGIVHRIDKDTTGLLMIAKNDKAMESLSLQLKNHSCNRRYVALVYGVIGEEKGRIEAPIGRDPIDRKKMTVIEGGKPAVTNFRVLKRFKEYTLIECKLETGRTHQIRVHLKYIGHPLVGDKVYGPRKVIGDQGQFLHAKTIGFIHPTTNEYMEFTSEIPQYFEDFMKDLKTI